MAKAIRIEQEVPVKMRYDAVLGADVFWPDDNEKHPAILIRSPYGKHHSADSDFLNVECAAFAGYTVVSQGVRVRFASEEFPSKNSTESRDAIE